MCHLSTHFALRTMYINLPTLLVMIPSSQKFYSVLKIPRKNLFPGLKYLFEIICFRPSSSLSKTILLFERTSGQMTLSLIMHSGSVLFYPHSKIIFVFYPLLFTAQLAPSLILHLDSVRFYTHTNILLYSTFI